ncbi:hypothetical protein K504DRAFT_502631 [Pleomassaria siparia CBS 279.74]|uniref:LYR motif-containing protein Cup1-like N-terminal domain-containing protein n=1 Tax=Pleomassaria siparia CBS 279.74 TaxID=1314801 RepID=A0A6G1K6U2_9PLEO|nr:hypothetical protein K504DRAFT_502631 [Pleomassaria siparia CBS 279.74]
MLSPVQHSASSLKTVHLLRALLREASYLPDQSARQYFRSYIVKRFKAYQPAHKATRPRDALALEEFRHRSVQRRRTAVIIQRTRATQRKAHKGLNYLRRANQGELPCLQKVLFLAYGRTGKRRYELLERLLRPELPSSSGGPPQLDHAMPPLHKLYYSDKRFLSFFDAPKQKSPDNYSIAISPRYARLKTVLQSQVKTDIALGRSLKRDHLQTPIRNIWQRPMPMKRARNNVRRWYAETMGRLLPPLPNDEWDGLRALATGERWIEFAKPRVPAIELHVEPRDNQAHSMALIEAGLKLDKQSKADRPWGTERPHNITPRFMRRLYEKIWGYSCKLDWVESQGGGRWNATWGNKIIRTKSYSLPVDQDLFTGVDLSGKIARVPKSEKALLV